MPRGIAPPPPPPLPGRDANPSYRAWKEIIQSQCYVKTKNTQVFFAEGPIKFKAPTQPLKTLKPLELT